MLCVSLRRNDTLSEESICFASLLKRGSTLEGIKCFASLLKRGSTLEGKIVLPPF